MVEAGQTSIFGVQAPAGVLLIYTRNGSELDYVNRKEGGLNFKGYEPAPDFETYMAEREKDRKLKRKSFLRFTGTRPWSRIRMGRP